MSSKNHEKSDYNLSLDLLSVSSMSHALYARRSGVIGKVTIEDTYTSWLIHTHTPPCNIAHTIPLTNKTKTNTHKSLEYMPHTSNNNNKKSSIKINILFQTKHIHTQMEHQLRETFFKHSFHYPSIYDKTSTFVNARGIYY